MENLQPATILNIVWVVYSIENMPMYPRKVQMFKTRDRKTLLKLYEAFVRPAIDYASIIWCPVSDSRRIREHNCHMTKKKKKK